MTPKQMKRVIELTAELEEILQGGATFLFGDNPDEIVGILVADRETTSSVMGDDVATSGLN